MREVIFDVETKKLFEEVEGWDPSKLGVSIVSCYRRELNNDWQEVRGEMRSFWEKEMDKMWTWFEEADRIIGFNSLGFDVPALKPYYGNGDLSGLKHFDIMAEIKKILGHRLGLDAIAKETLGESKSGVGTQAVEWWKAGDKESLEKLKKYCEMDVVVTRNIYDHGLNEGFLKFKDKWNELREVRVDFSYPQKKDKEEQIGLF